MKSNKDKKKAKQKKIEIEEQVLTTNLVQSRREFLNKLWKGLGILAVIEFAAVFFGFLFSGKSDDEKSKAVQLFDAGDANLFQSNSVTIFRGGRFYLVRLSDG